MTATPALDPRLAAAAAGNMVSARAKLPSTPAEKARAMAQDFESVFLNTMFQQMFAGVGGDGPMGGSGAVGMWRSFLTDEYAKTFAKNGGIGIADHVYRALIERQSAQSQGPAQPQKAL